MAHWYTADLHFSHARIIEFCKRPFTSVSEMNARLIANFQETVEHSDDLWIVGDFAFFGGQDQVGQLNGWFHALPGRKHLVVGNHDDQAILDLPWESVHQLVEVKDGRHQFVLCHYPMITWNRARRGAIQLFGHVHDQWPGSRNAVNVGVDMWDFKPVRADAILARAKTLQPNKHWADVEHGSELS